MKRIFISILLILILATSIATVEAANELGSDTPQPFEAWLGELGNDAPQSLEAWQAALGDDAPLYFEIALPDDYNADWPQQTDDTQPAPNDEPVIVIEGGGDGVTQTQFLAGMAAIIGAVLLALVGTNFQIASALRTLQNDPKTTNTAESLLIGLFGAPLLQKASQAFEALTELGKLGQMVTDGQPQIAPPPNTLAAVQLNPRELVIPVPDDLDVDETRLKLLDTVAQMRASPDAAPLG